MSHSVLLLDSVHPICEEVFEERGIKAVRKTKLSPDEVLQEIPEYEGIVVRSSTTVSKEVLEAAENLKVVGRAGVKNTWVRKSTAKIWE